MGLDDENPWDGILATTIFALRATIHATMQHTLAQLVFGHIEHTSRSTLVFN